MSHICVPDHAGIRNSNRRLIKEAQERKRELQTDMIAVENALATAEDAAAACQDDDIGLTVAALGREPPAQQIIEQEVGMKLAAAAARTDSLQSTSSFGSVASAMSFASKISDASSARGSAGRSFGNSSSSATTAAAAAAAGSSSFADPARFRPPPASPKPPPPPPVLPAELHVVLIGEEEAPHGPITAPEVRRLLTTGRLHRGSLCWREGMPAWTPLHASPFAAELGLQQASGPAMLKSAPPPLSKAAAAGDP